MKSFYKFAEFENGTFTCKDEFILSQEEIVLDKSLGNGKFSFKKQNIVYECRWKEGDNYNPNIPTIVIPTKNMSNLLQKTLKNLEDNNVTELCNILIVDDMSEDNIEKITTPHSYLRVENKKGFNFSMLNNIAALICSKKGNKQVIFWNNDLYVNNKQMLEEFIKRHNDNKSTISGSKLLYPPKEISYIKEEDSNNIKEYYKHVSGKWRNTVQYAGNIFIPIMQKIQTLTPHHYKRFGNPEDPRVNCDKGVDSLTGALMIVQLEEFVKIGGFNPSLSKNFQDTDLCLRVLEADGKIFYFGKDIHFYHDESVSLSGKKIGDKQLQSDEILFGKIWNKKIASIVL